MHDIQKFFLVKFIQYLKITKADTLESSLAECNIPKDGFLDAVDALRGELKPSQPGGLPTLRCRFRVEVDEEKLLIIRDVGEGKVVSVTNDAEAAVRLLSSIGVLRGRQLLYYDSAGQLGEIRHHDGHLVGFNARPVFVFNTSNLPPPPPVDYGPGRNILM